jgi:hypothetical protein
MTMGLRERGGCLVTGTGTGIEAGLVAVVGTRQEGEDHHLPSLVGLGGHRPGSLIRVVAEVVVLGSEEGRPHMVGGGQVGLVGSEGVQEWMAPWAQACPWYPCLPMVARIWSMMAVTLPLSSGPRL